MHRVGSLILLLVLIFAIFNSTGNTMVRAQSDKDIMIKLDDATFSRLTNTNANQLKVSIDYDVKNKAIRDSTINGIMEVYSSNGTLLKHSSFPNGFLANVTGTLVFKTTFTDRNLTDVIANVTIFDFGKKNPLSNTITSELILQKSNQN